MPSLENHPLGQGAVRFSLGGGFRGVRYFLQMVPASNRLQFLVNHFPSGLLVDITAQPPPLPTHTHTHTHTHEHTHTHTHTHTRTHTHTHPYTHKHTHTHSNPFCGSVKKDAENKLINRE